MITEKFAASSTSSVVSSVSIQQLFSQGDCRLLDDRRRATRAPCYSLSRFDYIRHLFLTVMIFWLVLLILLYKQHKLMLCGTSTAAINRFSTLLFLDSCHFGLGGKVCVLQDVRFCICSAPRLHGP